ncbi:unnamed protein product, partial [Timema podura]|nr:unnamed protein product [Timema podura]
VWSPSQRQTATTPGEPAAPSEEDKREDGVTIPVWTPKSSPVAERKEFRPVSFESPTLPRKNRSASATNIAPFAPEETKQSPPSSKSQVTTPVQPLWQQENDTSLQSPLSEKSAASSTLTSTFERRLVQSQSAPVSGLSSLASSSVKLPRAQNPTITLLQKARGLRILPSHYFRRPEVSGLSSLASSSVKLPRAQNPTITLLQKAREGQLPRGAHYLDHKMNSSDGDKGYTNPNEILYTVKKEYEAERDGDSRKKVVDLTPRKYEGIGPTTRDGIPIVLRSVRQTFHLLL